MPKTPPSDFDIHVDPSCLSNPTDTEMSPMSPERVSSNQTIIHHDVEDTPAATHNEDQGEHEEATQDEERLSQDARERQIDRIEAQIQAAARAVVASIEEDNYHGEESLLSVQTDESYDPEHSLMDYGTGTDLSYDPGSAITDNGTALTYSTEIDYGTEGTYETEDEHLEQEGEGDSSSHHDGDIDDDVFSSSGHSKRSSLNSLLEMNSSDEQHGKTLTSPTVGEEAASQPVSRIPSNASYIPRDTTPNTPSRVLARPPFRTPSSVRAIQMTSPTPSLYSSPRSTKRHVPTVSRIGTPNSPFSQSKRTPTRFKTKKEAPLVLLHVTVLPLTWTYSHAMSSAELPPSLQKVKHNWSLLHGQLGEAVLERGILLPHPQDDYEVLEERVLEALELPVRPRAKILKCGHYMGPDTSDDEGTGSFYQNRERKWCDICGKDMKFEASTEESGEQRFRVKIYASNGLMRAGAWAACWREMERVDVELEPFVDGPLAVELEQVAATTPLSPVKKEIEVDDGFVDEEEQEQVTEEQNAAELQKLEEEEELMKKIEEERRVEEEEELMRKIEEERRVEEEELMRKIEEERRVGEEELMRKIEEERRVEEEEELKKIEEGRRVEEEELLQRKLMDEQRMREIYGAPAPEVPPVTQQERPVGRQATSATEEESLSELLLAAFKIIMRDRRNIAIVVLSVLVLLLALKPRGVIITDPPSLREAAVQGVETVPRMLVDTPARIQEVVQETAIAQAPEIVVPVAHAPGVVAPVAPAPEIVVPVAHAPEIVAPVPEVVAPVPEVIAPVPEVVASVPDVGAPVPEAVAPVPEVVALVPKVGAPVAHAPEAVAPVHEVVVQLPKTVAPLAQVPKIVAPVARVAKAVEEVVPAAKQTRQARAQPLKVDAPIQRVVSKKQQPKPIVDIAQTQQASPDLEIISAKQPAPQLEIDSPKQAPSPLEISSTEVPAQAEHNDPDLKEVVIV